MSHATLSSQLQDISRQLADLGYAAPTGAIVPDYRYMGSRGKENRVDLLAFGSAQHLDISTACVAVQAWPNGSDKFAYLSSVRYLGVPVVMFATPLEVEVWTVGRDGAHRSHPHKTVRYERLTDFFQRREGLELSPRTLLSAKRGEYQLTFYDVDPTLVDFARDATQETLVEQFVRALATVPDETREKHAKAVTRLGIYVLAACILQDKLPGAPYLDAPNALVLLYALRQQYPHYFDYLQQDHRELGDETIIRLYDALRSGFTFRSLTNDMLAYFYENTLVEASARKALGIYYTPRDLARRILARLPVEDLAPENRTVLDGTCGSGNLLLAAYDRLEALLPARWTTYERHEYLRQHLWGIDKDSFACEVARLSLLIRDLPAPDGWRVEARDVFHTTPAGIFGGKPHIIVGNPPFAEQHTVKGPHRQRAAEVLDRYMEWLEPGGLLGIVLPITFLENPSAKGTRRKLLEGCDVLEVWHLPEGAIPSSSAATAVVLARKYPHSKSEGGITRHFLTRIEAHPPFRRDAQTEERGVACYVVPQGVWHTTTDWRMLSSPMTAIWENVERQFAPIHGTFATLHNGVQPGKRARPTHFSQQDEGPGWRAVLYDNVSGDTLEPFAVHWAAQQQKYIKYPSKELHRQRRPEHFERPAKIVVSGQRNAGSPWRFYAAIDRDRLVVTENFHYVLPMSTSPEELAAVLNSMAANAWYSAKTSQWNVRQATLKLLPFPTFTPQQRKLVRDTVVRIRQLKQTQREQAFPIVRRLVTRLDDIVFDAYRISDDERTLVRAYMDQYPRPGIEWERPAPVSVPPLRSPQPHWKLTGETESVDVDRMTIRLWTEGQDESVEIRIPPVMPGWMLRPSVAFQAHIPYNERSQTDLAAVTWLDFQPLDYGYLSDEELVADLFGR